MRIVCGNASGAPMVHRPSRSLKRCATLLAIGDAAEAWLDGYADDVADADRAVGGLDFSFEGATRLRFLVGHHAAALDSAPSAKSPGYTSSVVDAKASSEYAAVSASGESARPRAASRPCIATLVVA